MAPTVVARPVLCTAVLSVLVVGVAQLTTEEEPVSRLSECLKPVMSQEDYFACLARLRFSHHDPAQQRSVTSAVIRHQMGSMYCFADLILNSTDSIWSLPCPAAHLEVYPIALRAEFDRTWAEVAVEDSCAVYFFKANNLAWKMHDGHTVIVPGFLRNSYAAPSQPLTLAALENGELAVLGSLGTRVTRINGKGAVDYLASVVAERAAPEYKNRNVRFNAMLQRGVYVPWMNLDYGQPLERMELEYDGIFQHVDWVVETDVRALRSAERRSGGDLCNPAPGTISTYVDNAYTHLQLTKFEDLLTLFGEPPQRRKGRESAPPKPPPLAGRGGDAAMAHQHQLGPAPRTASASSAKQSAVPGETIQIATSEAMVPQASGDDSGGGRSDSRRGGGAAPPPAMEKARGEPAVIASVYCGEGKEVTAMWHAALGKDGRPTDKHVTVLKMAGAIEGPVTRWSDYWDVLARAVAHAAAYSDGELLVDVVGNGGGDMGLAVMNDYFLFRGMPGTFPYESMRDACGVFDYPKTHFVDLVADAVSAPPKVDVLLKSEGGLATKARAILAHMARVASEASVYFASAEVRENVRALFHAQGMHPPAHLSPDLGLGRAGKCLDGIAHAIARGREPSSLEADLVQCLSPMREELTGMLKAWAFLGILAPEPLAGAAAAQRGSGHVEAEGGAGEAGGTPRPLSSSSSKPSSPSPGGGGSGGEGGKDTWTAKSLDYYTREFRTYYRGRRKRRFSALFGDFACPDESHPVWRVALASSHRYGVGPGSLKSVKFVSDGTCFSACAVMVDSPFLRGLASVVTFGGIPGDDKMDISSGRGGNRAPWGEVQYNNVTGLEFIAAYVLGLTPLSEGAAPPLPFPMSMANGATVSFAQREIYNTVPLGFHALPSEWLRFPPSHHLRWWPKRYVFTPAPEFVDLYQRVADTEPRLFALPCNSNEVLKMNAAEASAFNSPASMLRAQAAARFDSQDGGGDGAQHRRRPQHWQRPWSEWLRAHSQGESGHAQSAPLFTPSMWLFLSRGDGGHFDDAWAHGDRQAFAGLAAVVPQGAGWRRGHAGVPQRWCAASWPWACLAASLLPMSIVAGAFALAAARHRAAPWAWRQERRRELPARGSTFASSVGTPPSPRLR